MTNITQQYGLRLVGDTSFTWDKLLYHHKNELSVSELLEPKLPELLPIQQVIAAGLLKNKFNGFTSTVLAYVYKPYNLTNPIFTCKLRVFHDPYGNINILKLEQLLTEYVTWVYAQTT